jgi:CheY-like chemotaxis protein
MEAVGQLAGGIAHDFNNLLTIINGYSDLLLLKLDRTDPERHLIQQINDAGWRSAALTKQLLIFSRKQIVRPGHIDLNPVIANLEVMLRRILGEDIALRSSLSPEPCHVLADPGRIEQVAMNLVVNARDAMPDGGELVIETSHAFLDDAYAAAHVNVRTGAYVVLTARDTGAGMTEEVKTHLFEPFFTTKGPDKGTGLGLAVVHGIVRDCEGHIGVESQLGRGTTFRIFLPMAAVPSGQSAPVATEEQASRGGTETILLVEDDAAVRAMTSHILSARGYFVLEAANGVAGLRIARSYTSRIDLLTTDIVMPGFSGRQLALAMRDSHPETRVLYVSGYSDTSLPRPALGHRKEYLIEKPFKPEALAVKVREVLDEA